MPGTSLLPAVKGGALQNRTLFFEHQSSCAVIADNWKLVRNDLNSPWELINLSTDPFETKDLSTRYPEKTRELEEMWNYWAETHRVLPLENKTWTERINYYKELNPDQSGREE